MRIVQTLELRDDPQLIEFYKAAHRPENIWPEIPQGIRRVGIVGMDIYLEGTRLVMILELAPGVDREEAMARLASLPRQAEWEAYVGRCQLCPEGSSSGAKWRPMEQIFQL